MQDSYALGTAEHERVYANIIEPAFFLDTSSVENPKVVFVGGQPGAGKTKLFKMSMEEFPDDNFVPINTDELRAFHPQFVEITESDDKLSAERTHKDASAWNRSLLNRCAETRRNMVVEGVFKDSAGLAGVIESLKASGYEVTIRLVAVHARHSLLGISSRYEQEKIVRGHGRYVPVDYHNECYERILQTIDLLESQKMVDRLEIYNRNGDLLYSNLVINGQWKDPPEGSSAMKQGRDLELGANEKFEYRESWHRVMELMYKRRASQDEVAQTKALADGLCKAVEED